MFKPKQVSLHSTADPVYLAASAVNNLLTVLPCGTAYSIGIVLVVMMTGQLMQHKGSLARAVWPYVLHLRWGWHRVHRAMERARFSLNTLFDTAFTWCLDNLEVEPVRLGQAAREVQAIDSSTIARVRASCRTALLGKGYCHRAGRCVRANIVAVCTSVVFIRGVRCGLVRRVRFGLTSEHAVESLLGDLPERNGQRLRVVDAGIATAAHFMAATQEDALLGRLRSNCKLSASPPPRTLRRGRPAVHGPVLHPGRAEPDRAPDEEETVAGEKGCIRLRRWNNLHFQESPQTIIDVVRIDDPAYNRPFLLGTNARELTTAEIRQGYGHRWPVETNFYVAEETTAMEKPRAWTEQALTRRIGLALLSGSLLKAISAVCHPLRMGPWDRQAKPSGGRLANHLDMHAGNFSALCLKRVAVRKYRKIEDALHTNDLEALKAA